MNDGELLNNGVWVIMQCVVGRIRRFRKQKLRGTFWQQVHELFHARKHTTPYDSYINQQHNVRSLSYRLHAIQTSVTKFYQVVAQLEARWPLHAAEEIVSFASSCSTCLNYSFTQSWSTHYVSCTHCHDVPYDRGMVIYVHTLLDETKEGVCVGRTDPLRKNLLDIRLIQLN